MGNNIEEIPVNVDDLSPGSRVIIAEKALSYSNKPTVYSYGRVKRISRDKKVITLDDDTRFDTRDGYLYTSDHIKKFTKCLLQSNDDIVAYIRRQELLTVLHTIVWELESTQTLEIMLHAYRAGLSMEVVDRL